jgi:hypothetical protein
LAGQGRQDHGHFGSGQSLARVEWTDQKTLLAIVTQGTRIEAANNPLLDPDALSWWPQQVNGVEIAMNALALIEIESP